MIGRFFLLLLLVMSAIPLASAGPTATGRHYTARLAVRSLSAKPGTSLDLAFVIQPEPGWHIYWSNPGESGYAPTFTWTLPAGMTAGHLRHPAPQLLMLGGIASNVHEGEAILLQSLSVPVSARQNIPLAVDLDMLVCSEGSCVPDPLHLDMTVAVGDGRLDASQAALFARAEAKIPQLLKAGAQYHLTGGKIRIFIPGMTWENGDKLHFFDYKNNQIKAGALQTVAQSEGGLIITVSAGENPVAKQISGVLRIDGAGGMIRAYAFNASASARLPAVIGHSDAKTTKGISFLLAFGAAILGGLLLNLMPCVFPILSLKALALARTGGNDREARIEAVGYSIGAIGVILALGATLLLLRSGGETLGWAFQLQDTRVVIFLLLLVTAIATNLAGMYELPSLSVTGRAQSGFAGAVSTGALAAFIATPCTGPFMAGALGAAIVLPTEEAMAVFFGLGLGLALPFLALGFIRPLRKWLPRPGPWMQKLRQVLSIPMFATALGLAWIIGREGGVNLMAGALGVALILSLGLWWYGLRQVSGKTLWPLLFPTVIVLALSVNLVRSNVEGNRHELQAESFSESHLAALRKSHKPVFVYITADWCLTCKVNEATSLSSVKVVAAFHKAGVTVMRGDWTRGDPVITDFLKKMGSAGVPLYLWYSGTGNIRQLSQILTPSMLTGLVRIAKD